MSVAAASWRVALVAAAGLALPACHKRPAPAPTGKDAAAPTAAARLAEVVVLSRVAVRRVGDPGLELYDEEMARRVGNKLTASGDFALADPADGRTVRRGRVELSLSAEVAAMGEGARSLLVAARADVVWEDGSEVAAPSDRVLVEQALAPDERNLVGLAATGAERAVDEAAAGLAADQALRSASDDDLVARVSAGGGDPAQLSWLFVLCGERHLSAAIDPIARQLAAADADVRAAALTALVAIGDPRAVAALVHDVDFQDYDRLRTLIEAVTALGGEDAVDFLEFVASGHPDADIKRRASEGLERLRRR